MAKKYILIKKGKGTIDIINFIMKYYYTEKKYEVNRNTDLFDSINLDKTDENFIL